MTCDVPAMLLRAPISHHLDLYRYWVAKRGSRTMAARRDLNPGDIPKLVPYLGLVDKVDGQFRWLLAGTAIAEKVGRNLTGTVVGSQVSYAPEVAAAARAIYERVFTTAHPIFATGEFKVKSGAIINMSLLVLPLSDDGADVNLALSAHVARLYFDVRAYTDRLKSARVKVHDVVVVHDAADLDRRCLDWERYCDDQRRRAEGI